MYRHTIIVAGVTVAVAVAAGVAAVTLAVADTAAVEASDVAKFLWHNKETVGSYTARYRVLAHCTSSLADLFIPTPSRLLWEAFSHAAISARRLFIDISTAIYSQVLIYTET